MKRERKNEGKVGIVRSAYFDYMYGQVDYDDIDGFRWDSIGGGARSAHKGVRIYGYVDYDIACNSGIACSGRHSGYHNNVKVCVVRKYTDTKIYEKILRIVGPKPKC